MSQIQKLIEKLKQKPVPSDIKHLELVRLLVHLGFEEIKTGKTSGSRIKYRQTNTGLQIRLHKSHGSDPVNQKALSATISALEENGLI